MMSGGIAHELSGVWTCSLLLSFSQFQSVKTSQPERDPSSSLPSQTIHGVLRHEEVSLGVRSLGENGNEREQDLHKQKNPAEYRRTKAKREILEAGGRRRGKEQKKSRRERKVILLSSTFV